MFYCRKVLCFCRTSEDRRLIYAWASFEDFFSICKWIEHIKNGYIDVQTIQYQFFWIQVPLLHAKNLFNMALCSSSSFTNTMICLYISFFTLPFHSFHYLLIHLIISILSTPFTTHPWINYFIVTWHLHTSMVDLIVVNHEDSSMPLDWKILQVTRIHQIHAYLSRRTKVI